MHRERARRPKIARLLAAPRGRAVRDLIRASINAQIAPTLYVGLRLPVTDYIYGDPEHPERVTRTISGPPYTAEDHALLAALRSYDDTLCPGCSNPIHEAWHAEMEGWYDADGYVCHACTARNGHEVAYTTLANTRPPSKGPLPPFSLADSTTKPAPPKSHT